MARRSTRRPVAGAFAVLVVLAAACADDPRPVRPAADVPAGAVGGSAPGPDGGATSRDAAVDDGEGGLGCLAGPRDVVLDTTYGGTLELGGVVRFPVTVEAGRLVVLQVSEAATGRLHETRVQLPARASSLRWLVRGLGAGRWLLRAQADQASTTQVGEQGDLDGYYDGSESSALLDPALARVVELDATCLDQLDYGIGVRL